MPSTPGAAAFVPKALVSGSALLLAVAVILGALSSVTIRTLRSTIREALIARENAERALLTKETELNLRQSGIAAREASIAKKEAEAAASEERLKQLSNENKQLEATVHGKSAEIAALQEQIDENQPLAANPGAPTTIELQAQLEDARQQLESAEQEKRVLAEKVQTARERSSQLEDEKKRRAVARNKVGVHGTILAVNHAYNFVVLNLGGRNGVEPHSEMLVVRDGTFIGKIHISSVEPATAIGDIIPSSLAHGVQVQPGDIVIYAGSNS